ncbi:MAG: hypothetical protein KAK00_04060 [Nanoarchaeota archaeon]|nr:hypothetical protein [Nanoarchaeota archaeon]
MKKIIISLVMILFAISIYADSICVPSDPFFGDPDFCPAEEEAAVVAPPPDSGTIEEEDLDLLAIISIKVSPSRPEPGEEVTVKIKVKNNAGEDIEDIDITVEFDGLEDDGGNDIEDDDNFDLEEGDSEQIKFTFIMPYDVEHGDSYNIIVEVKGKGKDTEGEYTAKNELGEIEFKKNRHEIIIGSLTISPSLLTCSNNIKLDYNIMNIGKEDERPLIRIINEQLNLNYKKSIELDENDDYSDSVRLAPELVQGTHQIDFIVEYDNNLVSKYVELEIDECKKKAKPKPKQEEKPEETKEVITNVYTPESKAESENSQPIAAKVVKKDRINFAQTDEYTLVLAIAFILLLGLVIFAVGAAFIILKK